jgi:monofunctional biosynthetic peptidoglycan transglycosylase
VNYKPKYLLIFILTIFGCTLFYLVSSRPDLDKLKSGYVKVNRTNEKISFKVVHKKPSRWVSLNDIGAELQAAIILSEDWAFYKHSGVDLRQLKQAIGEYLSGGRKRGASTITQQLVKNLYLTPEKSFSRKIKEVILSLMVERKLSKNKILEIYLNIIHLGKGIYGVGEGAKFYFKKDAKNLSAREGAFLAMLLPNPLRYSVSYDKKNLTPYGRKIINSILKKMRFTNKLSVRGYKQELNGVFSWEKDI